MRAVSRTVPVKPSERFKYGGDMTHVGFA